MAEAIKESDWKIFRELRPLALERFCERVLAEVEAIRVDDARSFHQRYVDIFKLVDRRDEALAHAFDNPRRSSALYQLTTIREQGLLSDEEFRRFSDETRESVESILRMRQY